MLPIAFLTLFLIPVVVAVYYYNTLVRVNQLLKEAASGVDVQLKRRHDLIPNLVEIVKGYAAHEKNLLEDVTRLRTQASNSSTLKESVGAENQLTKGLRTIFALAENYPDLKADQHFIHLHGSLVEVENELQLARRYFNGTVRDLNVLTQSFPSNIVANTFNFKPEEFFEIETVSERNTPEVKL